MLQHMFTADAEPRAGLLGSQGTQLSKPVSATEIAVLLTQRLEAELHAGPLRCVEGPTKALHGWEAHVYRFRLQGQCSLPPDYQQPLSLRAYDTPHALHRARHELAVMRFLHERGYPVPCPLLLAEDCQLLGGPFLILPWVPGVTLLEWLRRGFWRILNAADQLAGLHLALHALPLAGPFPSPATFVERRLDELNGMIGVYDLPELAPGHAWLRQHSPGPPARPSILHLDFHPVNAIVSDGRPQAVLDWSEADAGDRHADIAMTLVLLRTAPVAPASLHERLLARPARWWLARRYLRTYRRSSPLDPELLRFYLAWASLRRLAVCRVWRRAGPWVHGFKASALRHATPSHEAALRRVFREATGIHLSSGC